MIKIEPNSIDIHFAEHLAKLSGPPERETIYCTALLLSYLRSHGHVCFSVGEYAGRKLEVLFGERSTVRNLPSFPQWKEHLSGSPVVGSGEERRPLVFRKEGSEVYLYRYWRYERLLIADIERRIRPEREPEDGETDVEEIRLICGGLSAESRQIEAVRKALSRPFCIVSGGPGTGKTAIVTKIVALLLKRNPNCRIALAAPTGKAAARLKESILRGKRFLADSVDASILDLITGETSTVHRLLGVRSKSAGFRYDNDNRLPVDCLILDEASMVDLAMMSRLFQALREEAKVVLLGDRNQLSSVEAGMVFADICSAKSDSVRAHIVRLTKSHRFDESRGIGRLSRLVLSGEGEAAYRLLGEAENGDRTIGKVLPSPARFEPFVEEYILPYLKRYFAERSIEGAFSLFQSHMVLSALKKGPYGADSLNRTIERLAFDSGLVSRQEENYSGKPIIVTQNDYRLNLFNGDIGIYWADEKTRRLSVRFETPEGWRDVTPSRMPNHETAYAMTVHKSQGSEYDKIVFVLPETEHELSTRELVYTAVTRAKRCVEVWSTHAAFLRAVAGTTQRKSGLTSALSRSL